MDNRRITHSIKISHETYRRLMEIGFKGESFDQIINALLEQGKGHKIIQTEAQRG